MNNNVTESIINILVFGVMWGGFMIFFAKKGWIWSKQPVKFTGLCLLLGIVYNLLSYAIRYLLHRL